MLKGANHKPVRYFLTLTAVLLAGMLLILSPAAGFAAEKKADAQKAVASSVDINNATAKELEDIKGVGSATAKKIVANRPYKTVDELSKAGISAKAVADIKPFVTVGKAQAAPVTTAAEKAASKTKEASSATEKAAAKAKEATSASATDLKKTTRDTTKTAAKSASAAAVKLAPGTKININTADQAALEKLPEIGPAKAEAIIKGRPYKSPEDIMKVTGIKEKTFAAIKDYIIVK